MIEEIADAGLFSLAPFDEIVDVRTPAEFADDRLPGAINLPVLSDRERIEIGTIYKQESRFKARRFGGALIARNVAAHLEGALADRSAKWRPLLYCWRGGMRSGAMAVILERIGWRVGVLKGGYKTWRREVVAGLRDSAAPVNVILLDGQTGTAKSDILARVAGLGAQAIDLEALAAHRGSAFGAFAATPQPSQKLFESRLWDALRRLDPARPILLEAESNHIGACEIPKRLWKAMLAAPRIAIHAKADSRADYLLRAYADILGDGAAIATAIDRIAHLHEKSRIDEWRKLADAKDHRTLTFRLMREHYDPLYDRTRKKRGDKASAEISLQNFNDEALNKAAVKIDALLERLSN